MVTLKMMSEVEREAVLSLKKASLLICCYVVTNDSTGNDFFRSEFGGESAGKANYEEQAFDGNGSRCNK